MRRVLSLILLASFQAQAADLVPDLRSLDQVPMTVLPVQAVQKAVQAALPRKGLPLQFAVPVATDLGLEDGLWDAAPEGAARWRLRLFSAGALSLHVHLERLRLPEGGALWIYDTQGRLVQGPYRGGPGLTATAIVPGETAALELRVPAGQQEAVQLSIREVFHAYRDFAKLGGSTAKAGACEIDVACSQGNNWRDEIRSVARLQIGGFVCSGQLVNNVPQDDTPFLLTANHCDPEHDDADVMVVYWNFQRGSCGGSGSGDLSQNQSGASFRAADPATTNSSDYYLAELNSRPPAAFNVHYAGWDVTGANDVNSGAGIHHPQGDEKSISLFSTKAEPVDGVCVDGSDVSCELRVNAWQVVWSQGVTEQGSSGSGLWNQNRQLVGVLSGGGSDCSAPTAPDYYGRLHLAWNAGLKAELDPANTGILSLAGRGGSSSNSSSRQNFGGGGLMPLHLLLMALALQASRLISRRASRA